jgi:hypothetical protein
MRATGWGSVGISQWGAYVVDPTRFNRISRPIAQFSIA